MRETLVGWNLVVELVDADTLTRGVVDALDLVGHEGGFCHAADATAGTRELGGMEHVVVAIA